MKILKFPLSRICIWFILGLLTSFYLNASPKTALVLLGWVSIFFVLTYYLSIKRLDQKIYFGITTYALFFLIGISTQSLHNKRFFENHYVNKFKSEKNYFVGITLIEKLKSGASNERYIAAVTSLDSLKTQGKILFNIRKDSLNQKLEIGSQLLFYGEIYKHREPNNPNQFNYGKYLENKSIYGQVYADASELKVNAKLEKNMWYYAAAFRNRIITNLEKSGFAKEELNVVIALILGQQQDISPEVLKDYQLAGAVHILSVSGLHVGCIMIAIGFLLKPLPKTKFGELLKLFIIIAFLWLFALIAGFSPAVTRSVVMFTFVAIGKYSNRKTNIFHTLIASIFFILLVEPSFIFDVGFQLSYCALFFIVWLKPIFDKIWMPGNKILKYIWGILAVSFAAQIGAFPLSVYYFHQFPGLFFVTNLLVLPLLGIILALGVFVMLWASITAVPKLLAKLLEYSIFVLNKIINWVASFESFIFQDISFNWQMLATCYLMIFAFAIWIMKPNFKKLSLALVALLIFQITYLGTEYLNQSQEEFIVFNAKKTTLLSERKGKNIIVYSNDSLSEATMNFALKPYLVGNFASISKTEKISNLSYFNKNKILIIDSLSVFPENLNPDILILTQSPKLNLERIIQKSKPKMIVADASNYKTYAMRWKETCEKEKIPFHSTVEKGFYKLSKEN
ncbi:ComEC/Rec2 family competence protein [Flavobacterium macacae]|uniref:ComEC family competence protein n=1 Tax=Flavobacterium macacae TaxID=2488993 RepID=A0A3P3WGW1_9FLAO|nr:ComEC/Rec2 family competence protein [Flavobacterium macacae]RRJ93758.1 ComEC family competence protein [Flavobacterium macacae]